MTPDERLALRQIQQIEAQRRICDQENNPWGLTAREREVLEQMARHGDQRATAIAMGTSPRTVNHQVESAKRKLGTHTIGAVVAWAKYCSES
jgi:DNA-binding CsgD family transcriptional regulator